MRGLVAQAVFLVAMGIPLAVGLFRTYSAFVDGDGFLRGGIVACAVATICFLLAIHFDAKGRVL